MLSNSALLKYVFPDNDDNLQFYVGILDSGNHAKFVGRLLKT